MALGAPGAPIAGLPVPGQQVTTQGQIVPVAPAAAVISATKRDALQVDVDGDNKADPGDTIRYTVGITNTGADPATGVNFNDTLDPNTTLVPGSVRVSPLAFDDGPFTTVGNTLLAVGISPGAGIPAVVVPGSVLSNDTDFLGDTCCTIQSFSATSANGGTVSVNAAGNFTYLPPVGFTGTDTFTYILVDSGGLTSSPGIVTITVNTPRVWYVNNAAATNGDGRSTSPFNTLTNVNGAGGVGDADGPNDIIYLHTGSGNYTGGLPLESGQALIGQGVALVVNTITLNPAGSRPTITNSGGDAITLNTNNTIRGLNVLTGGAALFGIKSLVSSVGNLTIDNLSISGAGQPVDITNGGALTVTIDSISTTSSNNRGINLDGVTGTFTVNGGSLAGITGSDIRINAGTAAVTYAGTINNTSNLSVEVTNRTGGSATFSGAITDTGTGISVTGNSGGSTITFSNATKTLNTGTATAVTLTSNTGATITFSNGGLDIDTTSGTGILASGGGTINVSGSSNSITATAGKAMDLSGVTVSMTFATLSSTNSPTTGVSLSTVTGSLTSGGTTVTNPTGMGISVGSSSATLSFANTSVSGSGGTGVSLTSNSGGITFADLDISPDSGQRGLHATSNTGTLTTTSGTISTTSNTAVEIAGVSSASRTPLAMQLTSVSANGGPHGIFLQNTSGTFAVLGTTSGFCGGNVNTGTDPFTITAPNTADCTGGQIQNTTGSDTDPTLNPAGTGVRLNNATGVSLTRMWIHDHPNYGILGVGVSGFTLNDSVVNGTNGTNGATPFQEASIYFLELTGTNSMTRITVSGGRQDNVHIENTTGTLTSLTISNSQIQNNSTSTDGNIGYHVMSRSTANMTVTLQNSWLQGNRTDTINTDAADSSTLNTSIINNTIVAGTVGNNQGNLGIDVTAASSAQVTFLVDNNRVGTKDNAMTAGNKSPLLNTGINVFDGSAATSNMTGKITNNKVQNDDVSIPSGTSNGFGIRVFNSNLASMFVNATGNKVRGINTDYGMLLESSGTVAAPPAGRGLLAIGVINNDVRVGSNAIDDIRLQARNFNSICARVTGNDTGTGGTGFVGLFVRQANSAVFNLEGGTANLAANNPAADTTGFAGVITTVANGSCNTIPTRPIRSAVVVESAVNVNRAMNTGTTANGTGATKPSSVSNSEALTVVHDRLLERAMAARSQGYNSAKVTNASYSSSQSYVASSAALLIPADAVSVNIGTLPNAKRLIIIFDALINSPPIPAGVHNISNQGTVSGSNFSNTLTDDPDTGAPNDPTLTPLDAAPDLGIVKADNGQQVQYGDTISYTLTYSNSGTQGATGVIITDTVPAGTTFNPGSPSSAGWTCVPNNNAGSVCTYPVGPLAGGGAGGSVIFSIIVNGSLPVGIQTISNTACIGDDNANGPDPNTANNCSTDTTQVSVPTPTPTSTPTNTATNTATSTATNTATNTATRTSTSTQTQTATQTSTPTNTQTQTATSTATQTATQTNTPTNTPINTATSTATNTQTSTQTSTATNTATQTNTPTNTPINTATSTATNTATSTQTSTATSTGTNTATQTQTSTSTNTPVNTATSTQTRTSTSTSTSTVTNTAVNTATSTQTATGTNTSTATNTAIVTATSTRTNTALITSTNTAIATATSTNTATRTSTAPPTSTGTVTPVPTSTRTNTPLPTGTSTSTSVASATSTAVISATNTAVASATNTVVVVASATRTNTAVPSSTNTTVASSTSTRTNTAVVPSATATNTTIPATATSTPTACVLPFTDVDQYNPFYVFIKCLYCRGIISGYADGTFRPYDNITRGQMSKIVSNAAGFNDPVSGQTYTDVPPSHPFYVWIERLTMHNVANGYNTAGECPTGAPCFRPENTLTRGQMAKIDSNAAGFSDVPPAGTLTFTDVPPAHTFYLYIERLSRRGIISGYECGGPASEPCDAENRPYYRPQNNVTRGQSAKIVSNTFFPVDCTPGIPPILPGK
jgi:hypothetical protein